ncbi:MAG: glycosyl transferase family 90 [Chlamydiota bacterium]
MKALVTGLLVVIPLLLQGVTISQEKLFKKINSPPPEWMSLQIEEDLRAFKNTGITKEMLNKTIKEVYAVPTGRGAQFVRYQIQNNQITYYTPSENVSDVRITDFVKFIQLLAQYTQLPDIEFIVSLWDSYDRPIFKDKTYCPIFTMCRLKPNEVGVLFPEVRFFNQRENIFKEIERHSNLSPWEKKINKSHWRGGTTGGLYSEYEWDYKSRPRLVLFSKDHPDLIDAYFTYPYWLDEKLKMVFNEYDLFRAWMGQTTGIDHKYQIAVDGNTFPSSFWWQLVSNCVVLKGDSDYIEWFYKGVQPFVHYVPYNQDCSDLEEKFIWLQENDEKAHEIAKNATIFARENLQIEDMMLYFYTVFHAYAKLQR